MLASHLTPQRILYKLGHAKRYWIPLALLILVAVNVAGLFLKKRYESRAIVRIFSQNILERSSGEMSDVLKVADRLKTIREEIRSYDFLSDVAHDLNLDRGIAPNSIGHQQLVNRMADSLELSVRGNDLFTLTFLGESPQEARDVCDAIIRKYIRNSTQFFEARTQSATRMISTELEQAIRDLTRAQQEVLDYKRANINEIPEAQEAHRKRMDELQDEQVRAKQEMEGLRQKLAAAEEMLRAEPEKVVTEEILEESPSLKRLRDQKQQLSFEIKLMMQDFTEEHPKVVEAQRKIELIERQIATEEAIQNEPRVTKGRNPQYSSLKTDVLAHTQEIRRLETEIERRKSDLEELQAYMGKIPERQLELERKEGTKQMVLQRVMNLHAKLNEATLTQSIESQGQGPTFDPIDRPRLPLEPSSRRQFKVFVASIVLALGAAGALVLLLALFDRSVRSIAEARALLRMPVLGVMQRITTATEELRLRRIRRRRWVGFVSCSLLIVTLVVAGLVLWREPLLQGMDQLRAYFEAR